MLHWKKTVQIFVYSVNTFDQKPATFPERGIWLTDGPQLLPHLITTKWFLPTFCITFLKIKGFCEHLCVMVFKQFVHFAHKFDYIYCTYLEWLTFYLNFYTTEQLGFKGTAAEASEWEECKTENFETPWMWRLINLQIRIELKWYLWCQINSH